jgi:hypothetical protein
MDPCTRISKNLSHNVVALIVHHTPGSTIIYHLPDAISLGAFC